VETPCEIGRFVICGISLTANPYFTSEVRHVFLEIGSPFAIESRIVGLVGITAECSTAPDSDAAPASLPGL
jgi:hypothetical protein